MNNSICFENLHFSYDCEPILNGISANIEEDGIHSLFGPNGSGKTTLLKCLAGLLHPQNGIIRIEGQDICNQSAKHISKKLAYVPQEHIVSFPFTVFEVVLMGRTPHLSNFGRGPSQQDASIAKHALEQVDILDLLQKPFTELSGGQRQLTLIARALAQDTPTIILDEPTSALDFKNQLRVWDVLKMLGEQGKTILVCTHDPNHVLWFSDSVIVLKDGNIIGQGHPEDVLTDNLLTHLYGSVCKIDNGMIRPLQCTNKNNVNIGIC